MILRAAKQVVLPGPAKNRQGQTYLSMLIFEAAPNHVFFEFASKVTRSCAVQVHSCWTGAVV